MSDDRPASGEATGARVRVRPNPRDVVLTLLELAREQTRMDALWLSSFRNGRQTFDLIVGDRDRFGLREGDSTPLEDSYCVRVLDGRLPNIIPDTSSNSVTSELAVTADLGIAAYVGAPRETIDQGVAGMVCGVASAPNHSVTASDIKVLELLACAIDHIYLAADDDHRRIEQIRDRVSAVIALGTITPVFQPIVAISDRRLLGAEALSRFPSEPSRPDAWFHDAASVGLGTTLEVAALRAALVELDRIPRHAYMSINASAQLIASGELESVLESIPARRIVVEVTEHTAVDDYDSFDSSLHALRSRGVRLAIDDVGAGYSSFRHVLRLEPDIIKLDMSLTRDIDSDRARRGLTRGLLSVAADTTTVVAEGVMTQGELDTLFDIGVHAAQGFFLAPPAPMPLPDIDRLPRPSPRRRGLPQRIVDRRDAMALLADTMVGQADLEQLTRPILRAVTARSGLETSYLTIRNPSTGALDHRYVQNDGRIRLPEGLVVPWEDTLCKRCRDVGIIWTADVAHDLEPCEAAETFGVRTFLSIPIAEADGGELGSLCAASQRATMLDESVISEVAVLASVLAERIGQARRSSIAFI